MSSRYTETTKWQDTFFRKLSPNAKLLFLYITDMCDCAGFWEIDLEQACFHLRVKSLDEEFDELSSRYITDNKHIWLKNFMKHQRNASLNLSNNAHIGIVKCIAKHPSLAEQVLDYLGWDIKNILYEYR